MIDIELHHWLDTVVRMPEWSPFKGWVDAERPAIQQDRSEFMYFLQVLGGLRRHSILQLGLGHSGASHYAWSHLFMRATTIEQDIQNVSQYLKAIPRHQDQIIQGSTHEPRVRDLASYRGPYDLIFIDADHSYKAVRDDYLMYRGMIAPGGIIAFHDSVQKAHAVEVWKLIEQIKAERLVDTIGKNLGISYLRF